MKGLQKLTSFTAGVSVLALASLPAAPMTAVAAPLPGLDLDLSIVRAAAATPVGLTPATAVVSKGVTSGADDDAAAVKCLVKWFEPDFLKTFSWDSVVFLQAKLICNDTVGTSELLIEQNDQLVVAQTVVNNQTEVSMLNATVKLNDEQEDTFCVAVARAIGTGSYHVVAQECFHFDERELGRRAPKPKAPVPAARVD